MNSGTNIKMTNTDKAIYIVIRGNPRKNALYILGLIMLLLIALFVYLAITITNLTLLLGAVLIPIIIFIFLLKLFIWQLFGTEKITLKKKSLTIEYFYSYIYKNYREEFAVKNPTFQIKTITNEVYNWKDRSKIKADEIAKLIINYDDSESYVSSFNIRVNDLPDMKLLYQNLKKD